MFVDLFSSSLCSLSMCPLSDSSGPLGHTKIRAGPYLLNGLAREAASGKASCHATFVQRKGRCHFYGEGVVLSIEWSKSVKHFERCSTTCVSSSTLVSVLAPRTLDQSSHDSLGGPLTVPRHTVVRVESTNSRLQDRFDI